MTINRAIIIILDSVGIGALPDAVEYGDEGVNTLVHTAQAVGRLNVPNLQRMGLGNIAPIAGVEPTNTPQAHYGKLGTISKGKDTITGHWEMMGIITDPAFPTYPNGFPPEVISEFEARTGRETLANKPASGTEIIKELGEEHLRTGFPIVYTSADSVFQIAAHEDIIPIEDLYRMCEIAREMLKAPHNVQRVIARPFTGEPGAFTRTERRRDFSIEPTSTTLMDLLVTSGRGVMAIGKIEDIFAHRGITRSNHTGNNQASTEATFHEIQSGTESLVFSNLVDFDSVYGHRNDPQGYASALERFDSALPMITQSLRPDDLLIITADHGCDPTTPGTDHTREYVPILVYGKWMGQGSDLGVRRSLCDVAATLAELFGLEHRLCGESFADVVLP